ncbi:MAG: hypothetical protein U0235_11645 [Polyangiaceae bacterium]
MLESPVIMPPFDAALRARWARGSVKFDEIGCAGCHTREIPLYATDWREQSDSTNGTPVAVKIFLDGEFPKTGPGVKLFSDLRRHDMGAGLADTHDVGRRPAIGVSHAPLVGPRRLGALYARRSRGDDPRGRSSPTAASRGRATPSPHSRTRRGSRSPRLPARSAMRKPRLVVK